MEASLRDALLAHVPDGPRTIEMRALLALTQTECHGNVDGAVIASASRRVVALVGDPEDELVEHVLRAAAPPVTVLALHRPMARAPALVALRWKRATVMTLTDVARLDAVVTASRPRVAPLELEHLAHVPIGLGEELVSALGAGLVTCALSEDDLPASFAYAPFETETLFDVSVDTLPEHRGHGHATRAASVLIDEMLAMGRAPVWAAENDNLASIAVARKLGMTPLSHLFVAHVGVQGR